MKILLSSPYRDLAQSCLRGHARKPCMNCYKCARKILLEKALLGMPMENSLLNRIFKIPEVQSRLKRFPVHFENVFTYITAHYSGDHNLMNLLKMKTEGDVLDVSWMEKWYSPFQNHLADKYRSTISNNICRYIEPMTKEDERHVFPRDTEKLQKLQVYRNNHDAFVAALNRL